MAWLMLVLAFCFKIDESSSARIPLIGVFVVLFTIAYSPTAGTSPFSISAEVFPLVTREAGHALGVAVNMTFAGVLGLTFTWLSLAMRSYTASLALFVSLSMPKVLGNSCLTPVQSALNLVAFVLCFLFVPETKGRTIEELQFTFDLPTRRHIEYRIHHVLPYFVDKYILWQNPDPPVPFYRWARSQQSL